jgi:hypothetical protein
MNELNIIKMLIANQKCRHCGQHYELVNIEVLGHLEDLWLFTTYCSSCSKRGLAIVNLKKSEEPEAVAELTEAEKSHFSMQINSSDVLDMHIFLKDFNGDFAALFGIYS